MGKTRDKMVEDLKLRGYADGTVCVYVRCARQFVAHYMKPATALGEPEVRKFLLHLKEERELAATTRRGYRAAVDFLYTTTLGRPEVVAGIPWAKSGPRKLPDILSLAEMTQLLDAVGRLKHRAIVMTAYGAGLRISEACSLQVGDIDSDRSLIHVRKGKGGKERYVMLPTRLLTTLREYWRLERPPGPYLFPGRKPERPIGAEGVRAALRKAVKKAGIGKHVTPHCLRHSFATHLLEDGVDIRVIQALLGHSSIRSTALYTRVSKAHVTRIQSPLDRLVPARALGTRKAKKRTTRPPSRAKTRRTTK
jgi:site-specific recombinase XerD